MKLRNAQMTGSSHGNLKKSDVSWSQVKRRVSSGQLSQIRRFVEVQARLFSSLEDHFPVGDQGVAFSGCEPYVFSTMPWKQLESERMSLLRRAFAREAYNHTDKLRSLSGNALRRRLNFPSLESETRRRSLKWYQSLRARPNHHTIYLATLFGSFQQERTTDFDLNGSLSHRALPAPKTTC